MLYSKLFWGGLVVLFGVSIIINAIFKINFPFFKVFIALIIIFFGFKLLFGSFGVNFEDKNENSTIFGSNKVHVDKIEGDMEYNSVFGSQLIDFREAAVLQDESEIEINAVFGGIKVYLPDNVTIKLKASSAFGSVKTPSGEMISFGDTKKSYSKGDNPSKTIYLEANAVFGSIDLR